MRKITTLAISSFMLFAISCKKSSTDTTTSDDIAEAKIHSTDAATCDGETDAVDDDINNTVASSAKFCGTNIFNTGGHLPNDVDTNNSANSATKLVLTFNGNTLVTNPCRKRTGQIVIELLYKPKWVETGAVLKYTFIDFKVQDFCRNTSVKINGERFVTNVNGGNLVRLKLGLVNSLVHKIRNGASGLTVTFTDSLGTAKTANWNAARRNEIKFDTTNNGFYYSLNGDTTLNGVANTASWGTTRNGKTYTTVINSTVKANTNCKLWRPTAGVITHTVATFPFTVQLGLDANGNAVTSGCATHYKVSWTAGGGGSVINPYK